VTVAFCPCPPLLVPAVSGAGTQVTSALRAAVLAAVQSVLEELPEVVVVVGDGVPDGEAARSRPIRFGPGDAGDLRGFGVDLQVPFSGGIRPGGRRLPLAHTLGAWLLDQAGHTGMRLGVGPDDLAPALASLPSAVGVLAMGDGSARRSEKAPGHLDPAAAGFDAAVAAALASGDTAALAALDPAEGERLLAAGVPVWRAVGAALAGRPVVARLRYDDAPFGVGYLVADWHVP
jgi:hypothetical protein